MLVSDDGELVARARHLATQAREPAPHYEHAEVGFNYRMSNLLAALGRAQLRLAAPARRAPPRHQGSATATALGDRPGITFMPDAAYGEPINWLTVAQIDPAAAGATARTCAWRSRPHDIEARPAWKPLHLQPLFAGRRVVGGAVAERIFDHGLCLPSGSSLTDADQDRVIEVLRSARRPRRRDRVRGSGRRRRRSARRLTHAGAAPSSRPMPPATLRSNQRMPSLTWIGERASRHGIGVAVAVGPGAGQRRRAEPATHRPLGLGVGPASALG